MKKFNNYEDAKKKAQYNAAKLPVGAYICKIMGVRYENATEEGRSDTIVVQFDISEGEQKDFFKNQYEANTQEDKKWKGVYRLYVPKDDGSDQDAWTKTAFARWTNNLEKCNNGYSWDWEESKWKGKLIGIVFGETGTVIDGKNVVYTEPRSSATLEEVREGTYYKQGFKARNGYKANGSAASSALNDGFMSIPDNAKEDIPF